MSVDGEHVETVDDEEDRIETLKQQKAKDKTAFTKNKNKLLSLLDEEDYPSRREVKAACQMLCEQWKNYLRNIYAQKGKRNEKGSPMKWTD